MDNLSYLLGLYDITSIPEWLRKERELKRWRDIMAQQRLVQDYLKNFLEEEAKARESEIPPEASFEHKRRMAMRWFAYYKKAKTVDEACKIGKQYNMIANMCSRERN